MTVECLAQGLTVLPSTRLISIFLHHFRRICREKTFHAASKLHSTFIGKNYAQRSVIRLWKKRFGEDQPQRCYVVRMVLIDPCVDLKFNRFGFKAFIMGSIARALSRNLERRLFKNLMAYL